MPDTGYDVHEHKQLKYDVEKLERGALTGRNQKFVYIDGKKTGNCMISENGCESDHVESLRSQINENEWDTLNNVQGKLP